jgi:Tfp pilus assembly protein PilX
MVEYIGLMPLNQPSADIDMSAEAAEGIPQIPHVFRITAIGYGQNQRIYSVLQSIYSTVK